MVSYYLLGYLNCDLFEPLFQKNIHIVTQKFLCLLLLATGRRIDEVGHFSKKQKIGQQGNLYTLYCMAGFSP